MGLHCNNILIYTVPLEDENTVAENISAVRDSIGKIHIPGSKEGMYMITEAAYTPYTVETKIKDKKVQFHYVNLPSYPLYIC